MQRLKAIWDNTYSLLVDDGQLALGAWPGSRRPACAVCWHRQRPSRRMPAPCFWAGHVSWSSVTSLLRGVMPDASWRALWCATALGMMGRRSKEDYGFRCSAAQ